MPQTRGQGSKNENLHLNLPDYQNMPETAIGSEYASPRTGQRQATKMHVQVELNRSSELSAQVQKPRP